MDVNILLELISAQYRSIQEHNTTPNELGPAREQAFEAGIENVSSTIIALSKLNRQLISFDTSIARIRFRSISHGLVEAVFVERYTEKYRNSNDGESFITKGSRIHECLLLKDQRTWIVLKHNPLNFDPSPTSLSNQTCSVPSPKLRRKGIRSGPVWTWDGGAAADYSDQYWENYNSAYRTYDNDCTNFASQCLKAGGKVELDGDRTDNRFWDYGFIIGTTSYSWAGAHNLYLHLKDYTNSTATADNSFSGLRRGDLVFLDFSSNGDINHTMIVSKVLSNDVLLNYHTNDTFQKSYVDLRRENPNDTFKGIKVGTEYL